MATRNNDVKAGRILLVLISLSVAIVPAILTSHFGFGFSPILTGSMSPSASPGDVFVTRLVPASSLKVGDIVAANNQATGVYYSHRVVEIRIMNEILRITTKGDANELVDRNPVMVAPTGEISKVIFRVPWIGHLLVYLNTTQGRQSAIALVVIANLLALFAFLFRKKIIPNLNSEKIYKELYVEERLNSEQYRDVIDNLNVALAEEKSNIRKINSQLARSKVNEDHSATN